MSSTSTLYQSVPDASATRRDGGDRPRSLATQGGQHHIHRGHLSALSPGLGLGSHSVSPAFNTQTPAESVSTLSIHYPSSEFSEVDDPFFGVNFNTVEGASPSFLDEDRLGPGLDEPLAEQLADIPFASTNTQHGNQTATYLPLSPDKSPSLPPTGEETTDRATRGRFPGLSETFVAPRELSAPTHPPSPALQGKQPGFHMTPRTSNSGQFSDDSIPRAASVMHGQSPRVTVSHWDRDGGRGSYALNADGPHGDGEPVFSAARDDAGRWIPDQSTGQSGLDPPLRSAAEVASVNELAAQRHLSERNREVGDWLEKSAALSHPDSQARLQPAGPPTDGDDYIPQREVSMGDKTENKAVPGQTYFLEKGGELTREDLELMRQGHIWADAPLPFSISRPDSARHQPESSQEAIKRFEQMCRDNDSVVSRAATWGTRRLSLPSIVDTEVEAAGNFLKKLSLSRGEARRPSFLDGLRGFVRKPSVNLNKRSRAELDDASSFVTKSLMERKESQTKLAPPSPKPGWTRKHSVPSINTAFVDMGNTVASIGAAHARASSISATPITSPKSPNAFSLSVKKPLNRLRSKSENQSSGIVDLWKRSGGPPVSSLGNSKVNVPEPDDDEDDEDELLEDSDMRTEPSTLVDDITPNLDGFRQQVLKLNPFLSTTNSYLVDRIAYQQCARYKALLNAKVKHLQAIAAKNCSCGSMCVALGGSPNILDSKGDPRGGDPLSANGSDGDITPLEGVINQESFPQDIPMPPTSTLPAEFECQLCFTAKKFQKPSDWTKHVHEDVQPFTCTWERCRDPKMFKRKADWVRHENEGHRHLEWWTCDVEDCRHVCYRRDNFLQHLVREHKFIEPKVKTKAAIKKSGGVDPTWQKVEQCHHETRELPANEPCRFCGRTFPTWKKLTVHLAKHMEQISLPIIKLVAKKELDEDAIISPVQEPPPRAFPATLPNKQQQQQQQAFDLSPTLPQGPMAYPNPAHHQAQPLLYPIAPPGYPAAGLYTPGFDPLSQGMPQPQLNMPPVPVAGSHAFQSLNSQAAFSNLPVTTTATTTSSGGAYMTDTYISMAPDMEPFPALTLDGLGLQAPVQLPYGGGGGGAMMDPHPHHVAGPGPGTEQQFTPQQGSVSVSPYSHSHSHSPHQPQGGFYR
ncbi:hypothetical protein VTK56DRAFT_3544 [Thermocarpiscus australiensis]